MNSIFNHVKRAITGEEKLWKIVLFWVFLGNMIWIQEVYIYLYVAPENQVIIVPYYLQWMVLRLYIPFSIFLLWRNVKNSSPLNVILARTGCALLVVVCLLIFVLEYVGRNPMVLAPFER